MHWLRFLDKPLIRSADSLRDQRRWLEAVSIYREIVRRRPKRAGVWVQLGHCLAKIGQLDEAVSAYKAANACRPNHPDTLFHLAHILMRLNRSPEAELLFARLMTLQPERQDLPRYAQLAASGEQNLLNHVILGTTGTCNASCVHCPTGKPSTAGSPRNPMPMPLFRKIIDEIADSGREVVGQVAFGLFGDALADPHVLERAKYLRTRLPNACLSINTNGAAYNPTNHAALNEYVSIIALHCESIIPETYNYLMKPLRLERVRAKYALLCRDFPGKVHVAAPMSRLNADERPALMEYFYRLGAIDVSFTPLSNRLATDEQLFDQLSFAPVSIACNPSIFQNLIVDCDGTVLACCNDFSRVEPVGDLSRDSLSDTLVHRQRQAFRDKLAGGCHSEISTCNRCRGDVPASIPPIDAKVQQTA